MKLHRIALGLCLALSFSFAAQASDDVRADVIQQLEAVAPGVLTDTEAAAISEVLKEALASDHRGLETAALRLVIAYAPEIDLNRSAVIEMVRLYRDHSDELVRQMAVVALGASKDNWGTDFLERSVRFEDSKKIRHTIQAVLAEA